MRTLTFTVRYLTVLEELYPRVLPGGVILFDEYGEDEKWPGAQRAIEGYFGDRISLMRRDDRFVERDGKRVLVQVEDRGCR